MNQQRGTAAIRLALIAFTLLLTSWCATVSAQLLGLKP
jgi:hypothetical protein